MSMVVADLKQLRQSTQANLPDLGPILAQLIGEPFLFARLGYAGELTVHFGVPRPADHPRLLAKGMQYGSHMLAVCASSWVLKSNRWLIAEELDNANPLVEKTSKHGESDAKNLLVSGELIPFGTRVAAIEPFVSKLSDGIAVLIELADGSGIVVKPIVEIDPETNQPVDFPDWELKTPLGLARIGPGLQWRWEPKGTP
jgi:hypothetical protein